MCLAGGGFGTGNNSAVTCYMRAFRAIIATGILFALVMAVVVPLHAQAEAASLRVMSYNLHRGGVVMLKQPLSQTAKAIQLAKADIVGVQETRSPRGDKLEELANLLGWNHDMGKGSNIVTRYEIVEPLYRGVKVKLDSGRHALISLMSIFPLILTSLISCWRFVRDGISIRMTLPSSRPKPRQLNGQKRHGVQRLQKFSGKSNHYPINRPPFSY